MNLMFRKNFREGAKSSGGGGGGIKLQSKASRSQVKRSRDMGYGNMDADVHYRTHLFFSPNRGLNSNDCEGLCEFYVVSIICVYQCVRMRVFLSLPLSPFLFLSFTLLFFLCLSLLLFFSMLV